MSENFEDKLLYEINPIAKIYHCNNIDCLIKRMESAVAEFREKAPHRNDYIEATENSILEMRQLKIWIECLYRAMEVNQRFSLQARIISDIHWDTAKQIEMEKRRLKAEVDKLVQTLDFNEK